VELSLGAVGVPVTFDLSGMRTDLTVFVAGGYRWMSQQGTTTVEGVRGFPTGEAQVTQLNDVACFDLGARFRLDIGELLAPFVGIGLAFDVTNSSFEAYSLEPVNKHSTTLGLGVDAGTWLRLGPGALFVAAEYRHTEAKMGKFEKIGSAMLSEVALQIGYGLAIGGWGL